jgi:excisionase family DNA binding protein
MDEEKLMTAKEAADYLRMSPKNGHQTIQRWVRKGLLKGGRVGDRYIFRKRDLDNFTFSRR